MASICRECCPSSTENISKSPFPSLLSFPVVQYNSFTTFQITQYLSSFETRPHNTLALKFISDFLYGKSNQLADFLGESARLTALKEKDSQFWVALIKKYVDSTLVP